MRSVAGFDVVLGEFVEGDVSGDEGLADAVGLAALLVIDIAIVENDLGGNENIAFRAERRCLAVKNVR